MGKIHTFLQDALYCQGASGEKYDGRMAVESRKRRVRASRSMADNPPDPQQLCFWLSPSLA
eukprot:1156837-Pelagomonas_calceolata.AAC.2